MAKPVSCMVCGYNIFMPRGLLIYGLFLCKTCEDRIINASPEEPSYSDYINGLKKIWRSRVI